jgi:hypothetical protein
VSTFLHKINIFRVEEHYFTLKTGAADSSETLVHIYQPIQNDGPEDSNLYSPHCEEPKISHKTQKEISEHRSTIFVIKNGL